MKQTNSTETKVKIKKPRINKILEFPQVSINFKVLKPSENVLR